VHKIAALCMPVLIVHGAGDHLVPPRFSEELYEAAPQPKRLLVVAGATHNNSMRVGSAEYLDAMRELFGIGLSNSTAAPADDEEPSLTASLEHQS
jgi:fermentation-respiration switch protein FrsA (DUF1100 family)